MHPWHLRGRTVQLFFDLLLCLIIFVFARFASCFFYFSAASCKFGSSADTILNSFAIFSSFKSVVS